MGKRKERRMAAMSATGRRVKLDLFAEPTGEMDRKPSKEEDTGDPDQDHHAGVPSSPSSSGHKKENPLLLLGQYSDDEVNDDATTEPQIEVEEKLGTNQKKENGDDNQNGSPECCTAKEDGTVDKKSIENELDLGQDDLQKNNILTQDAPSHDTIIDDCVYSLSEMQNAPDSVDGWKILVDEQTNRYYYWNTLTGETSWEVPDTYHGASITDGTNGFIVEGKNAHGVNMIPDAHQSSELYDSSGVLGISYTNTLMVHSFGTFGNVKSEEKHLPGADYNNSEAVEFDPDHLVKLGEVLIQRLKALERPVENLERQNWRLKCISEVEMRLSDCKILSSYGSSLLPFWWHTNTQLKRINDSLDQEESPVLEIPDLSLKPETIISPKQMPNSPKSDSSGDSQDSKAEETVMDNPNKDADPSTAKSCEEDMDMDVEMEVDEESVAHEESALPLSEDWIPPPPPPEEHVIPPPPTEEPPPEPGPPPSHSDSYPSFSYAEQYTVPYPVTALDYYVPSASGGVGVAEYYAEPQPVAAVPYYDQPASSSEFSLVPPVVYYDVSAPVSVKPDVVRYGSRSSMERPSSAPSTSVAAQSTGTSSSDVAATTKVQPKAARGKKRTVVTTLRSNKKVSSLVDKWKAAKEELHGDEEDEPEEPYEILEKKRQREIEQWKARQIASGEAQENANFLPLGGDWRERVKRRRAEANAQPSPSGDEAASDKKQPDLSQLAKGLPSGWKVYWDASTQEVYYSNTLTAETTWIRPSS